MANPHLERIEYGIGDRRGDGAMGGFAGAKRLQVRPRDDFDAHVRHLAEAENGIIGPVVAGDALIVETNALFQHPTGRLDGAALDLVDHTIRIDGLADVDGNGQTFDAYILGAFYLGDDGAIGAGVLVTAKADAIAVARAFGRFPVRAPGGGA